MDNATPTDETRLMNEPDAPSSETECPYCGAELKPDTKFCGGCGYQPGSLEGGAEEAAKPSAPVIELAVGDEVFDLAEGEHILGRSEGDLVVSNAYLSRKHAKLVVREGRLFIGDLGSTNGTFVDGVKLEPDEERELHPESVVKAGELPLTFTWPDAPVAESAEPAEGVEEAATQPAEAEVPAAAHVDQEVAEVGSPWRLKTADQEYPLPFGEIRLGRKEDRNDLAFPADGYMSGAHLVLDVDLDTLKLKDLGSTNGTLVRGEKVAPDEWLELTSGDEFQAGQTVFTVEVIAPVETLEPMADEPGPSEPEPPAEAADAEETPPEEPEA